MKNQPDNELFSAYLDGELTAAQRAQVEQLLADSPSARQLLGELRALSGALQSLPRQKLGEDLSEKILQIAAKRKTSEADAPQPATQGRQLATIRPLLRRQIAERVMNNPRMVVWPLIVVTVAVLLMVFNPDQPGPGRGNANRNVALAPANQPAAKTAKNEERAVGAKIVEPTEGDLVRTDDHPSMRAMEPLHAAPKPALLAVKGSADKEEKQVQPSTASRAGLIVVQCQVTREVLKQQDYRKILDDNHIAWSDEAAGDELNFTPSELAAAAAINNPAPAEKPGAAGTMPEADLVLVEATPSQIAATLNGLKTMPEKFFAVSVRTSPMANDAGMSARDTSAEKSIPKIVSRAQRVPLSSLAAQPSTPTTATETPPAKRMMRAAASPKSLDTTPRREIAAPATIATPTQNAVAPAASAVTPPTQRVLFVFQAVDPAPAADAEQREPAQAAAPGEPAPTAPPKE